MPFFVMLWPGAATPPRPQAEREIQAVVSADARPGGPHGAMRTGDGAVFSLDGASLQTDRVTPGLCRIVFDAARRTSSFVVTGIGGRPIRVSASAGDAPPDLPAPTVAPDPPALCMRLQRAYRTWTRFEKAEQSEGPAAPDGDLLAPPGDPGAETRLAADPSGVAAQCAAGAHGLANRGHWKTVTTVISQSPKWGTVWRADVMMGDSPDSMFRQVCWRPPQSAHGAVAVTIQPLQMFDPARSLAPLASEAPPPAR
ncbi:MAG: hypothetical protein P4L73_00160 [Caulobacteraceae bacterium]|nr:hypothetical protein [Caulobacteraceae bacterium]